MTVFIHQMWVLFTERLHSSLVYCFIICDANKNHVLFFSARSTWWVILDGVFFLRTDFLIISCILIFIFISAQCWRESPFYCDSSRVALTKLGHFHSYISCIFNHVYRNNVHSTLRTKCYPNKRNLHSNHVDSFILLFFCLLSRFFEKQEPHNRAQNNERSSRKTFSTFTFHRLFEQRNLSD